MSAEINHILCAYDGGEKSKKAIEYAINLHKAFSGSHLTVVHVYNEKVEQKLTDAAVSPIPAKEGYYIDPSQNQSVIPIEQGFDRSDNTHTIIKNSVTDAENTVKRMYSDNRVDGVFEILEGNPGDSISEYAKRTGADLIIIGESDKSGFQKFFTGSTSSSLIKDAPCSVLLAK